MSVSSVLSLTVQTSTAGEKKKKEQGRTDVFPEISSVNDKDNGSDLGLSSGFATLLRLTLLTSTWKRQ